MKQRFLVGMMLFLFLLISMFAGCSFSSTTPSGTYTITYYLDGGINSENNPSTFTVETETFIFDSPTKEGYSFVGWFSNSSFQGTTVTYLLIGSQGNQFLYAKWEINQYYVSYYYWPDDYNPLTDFLLQPGETVIQVSLGGGHSSALTSTGRVFMWGWNYYGQLGDGTTTTRLTPTEITSNFDLASDETIIQVSLGSQYSSALSSTGRVFMWGQNSCGMLGDGTTTNRLTPTEITNNFDLASEETIQKITLGECHSSALTSAGRVFVWGWNNCGQLGDGTTTNRLLPIDITEDFGLVSGEKILNVSFGYQHSSSLTSSGRLFIWGFNEDGQLGDGTTTNRLTPTEITNNFDLASDETIIQVSLGSLFSSVLSSTGRVFMWGWNYYGQLGDGTTRNHWTPVEITNRFELSTDETIHQILLGGEHSSVLTSTGRVFVWGKNYDGQLGDGTTTNRSTPTEITSRFNLMAGETILQVSLGGGFSSALTSTGRVFMWGENQMGSIGNNSTTDRINPTIISNRFKTPILLQEESLNFGSSFSEVPSNRIGYHIGEWYMDTSLTEPNPFSTMPSYDLTLFGKWSEIEYEIQYILEGGSNSDDNPQTYTFWDSITFSNPTREGYIFLGWYENPDFSGEPIVTIPFGSMRNITLYALWQINQYTISFEENGGSSVSDIVGNFGTVVSTPPNPTRQGYTFEGWYSDAVLTQKFVFSTMPARNLTLYAKWNPQVFVVTYYQNNGKDNEIAVGYAGSVFSLLIPTYSGYTFGGWYLDQSFQNPFYSSIFPTTDISLYAKWYPN